MFCSARSTLQAAELLENRAPDDASRVRLVTWTGCTREGAVKLLRAEGGGHNRDTESAEEA